jgi:hypothetical protein
VKLTDSINLDLSSHNKTGNGIINTKTSNVSFLKSHNNTSIKKKKENYEIFQLVCPKLDMSQFSYSKKLVRQIKLLFRYFYDNRNNFISEIKKKALEKKLESTQIQQSKSVNKLRKKSPEERDYVDIYGKKISLVMIYQHQKEKTRKDIERIKKEKEDKINKECTFKPKISNYESK